ncbi:MAG: hypothetical protein ACI93T_004542, partial [Porticoccaceae bacterium]
AEVPNDVFRKLRRVVMAETFCTARVCELLSFHLSRLRERSASQGRVRVLFLNQVLV